MSGCGNEQLGNNTHIILMSRLYFIAQSGNDKFSGHDFIFYSLFLFLFLIFIIYSFFIPETSMLPAFLCNTSRRVRKTFFQMYLLRWLVHDAMPPNTQILVQKSLTYISRCWLVTTSPKLLHDCLSSSLVGCLGTWLFINYDQLIKIPGHL